MIASKNNWYAMNNLKMKNLIFWYPRMGWFGHSDDEDDDDEYEDENGNVE